VHPEFNFVRLQPNNVDFNPVQAAAMAADSEREVIVPGGSAPRFFINVLEFNNKTVQALLELSADGFWDIMWGHEYIYPDTPDKFAAFRVKGIWI
jgi:hypothetical protein